MPLNPIGYARQQAPIPIGTGWIPPPGGVTRFFHWMQLLHRLPCSAQFVTRPIRRRSDSRLTRSSNKGFHGIFNSIKSTGDEITDFLAPPTAASFGAGRFGVLSAAIEGTRRSVAVSARQSALQCHLRRHSKSIRAIIGHNRTVCCAEAIVVDAHRWPCFIIFILFDSNCHYL